MAFLVWLTAFAAAYTGFAFRLDFMGRGGALGPGFFPRIIGVLLLLLLASEIVMRRLPGTRAVETDPLDEGQATHPRATLRIGVAAVAFAVVLPWVGGFLAMALFLAVGLAVLNPGHWRVNLALTLVVPTVLLLLFSSWLGVPLPPGLIGFTG